MDSAISFSADFHSSTRADRIGVVASVLCAIHCAVTPFLLIFAPAFGGIWSHPLSHWIAAAFVVPLAVVMVVRGYRRHHKRWIMVMGVLGVSSVLLGAALPHVLPAAETSGIITTGEAAACTDACCPSVVTNAQGESRLNIPPTAAVTTLGGLFLIITHVGNIRAGCACKGKHAPVPCCKS